MSNIILTLALQKEVKTMARSISNTTSKTIKTTVKFIKFFSIKNLLALPFQAQLDLLFTSALIINIIVALISRITVGHVEGDVFLYCCEIVGAWMTLSLCCYMGKESARKEWEKRNVK